MNARQLLLASTIWMALQAAAPASWAQAGETLPARVAALEKLVSEGQWGATVDVLPPRMLTAFAARFNIPESAVGPAVDATMSEAMEGNRFVEFGMDLAAAGTLTTPGGERQYVLIPTHTVMRVGEVETVRTDNQTLALQENGQWYLVRIDNEAQVALLKSVYPEFGDVDFPTGTLRSIGPE